MCSLKKVLILLVCCFIKVSKCENQHTHVNKTYRGKEVSIETVPYTIAINIGCTGVLIRDQWILTAKHCVKDNIKILLGVVDYRDYKYTINVEKVYLQPGVTNTTDPWLMAKEDIALLKLSEPAKLSNLIKPIDLERIEWPNGVKERRCTLAGFGYHEKKNFYLHQTEFIANYRDGLCSCNLSLGTVCADAVEKNDGTCLGDSGSALICDNKAVAIASYIMGMDYCETRNESKIYMQDSRQFEICNNEKMIAVLTHIYPHLKWIDKFLPQISLRSAKSSKNGTNWEENKSTPPAIIQPTKWEFPRDKLRLQTVLGQGNFGQVWKAEADDICDHEGLTRLVAVKTVKEGASSREKEDLLRELGIMQELGAHPNVVTLLGCCTDKEPYLLIMEYVMYGKLLAFLREHRTRAHYFNFSDLSSALTSRDLTVFAYCVARGMEYLVSKGIIHRDLAARNILVDHNKLCKIADFGMSRNVRDTGQIYEQRPNRGALPIRWMAPESLHFSLFTHSSDVWSFGILLWEIITLGSTPYNTMGAREVMRKVREGYRLEKPKHCKSEFYKVVTKCWHSDPTKRPSFTELKQDIGTLLSDKDTEGGFVDLEALAEEMCDQGH